MDRHMQTHVEKQCEGAASGAGQEIQHATAQNLLEEVGEPDFNIEDIDPSRLAGEFEEQILQATEEDSDWDLVVQLDRMVNEVDSQMIFECGSCGAKFEKKRQLTRHTREEHGKRSDFECEVCREVFVFKSTLKRHIREVHSERREVVCEVCDKYFTCNKNLRQHIREVHGDECKMVCPKCKKQYASKRNLTRHIREIHDEKCAFVFVEYENAFPTGQDLHEHTHAKPSKRRRLDDEGEAACQREPSQPSQPTSPVASTSALPSSEPQPGLQRCVILKMSYNCKICGRTYERKTSLDTHTRHKHGDVSEFRCEECGKAYTTWTGLKTHKRKAHLRPDDRDVDEPSTSRASAGSHSSLPSTSKRII